MCENRKMFIQVDFEIKTFFHIFLEILNILSIFMFKSAKKNSFRDCFANKSFEGFSVSGF